MTIYYFFHLLPSIKRFVSHTPQFKMHRYIHRLRYCSPPLFPKLYGYLLQKTSNLNLKPISKPGVPNRGPSGPPGGHGTLNGGHGYKIEFWGAMEDFRGATTQVNFQSKCTNYDANHQLLLMQPTFRGDGKEVMRKHLCQCCQVTIFVCVCVVIAGRLKRELFVVVI